MKSSTALVFIILLQCRSLTVSATDTLTSGSSFPDALLKKNIQPNAHPFFKENKGQVVDQNLKSRPDIFFSGTDGEMVYHIRKGGISYQLNKSEDSKKEEDLTSVFYKSKEIKIATNRVSIYRLDVDFLNANVDVNIEKGKELNEGVDNYYLAGCPTGALNVKTYTDVILKKIYNGIDIKWYEKDGHLGYDFIVSAGADYNQIKLKIDGAEKVSLNENGELVMQTPFGDITENAPVVIQNNKILPSKWQVSGDVVNFKIDNINPLESFIIDPSIRLWGTYYGGSGGFGGTQGFSCTTDVKGNIYLAGLTGTPGVQIIATSGSHQTLIGGFVDAFLVKFDANGVRKWGTYYGGTNEDIGYSCATDKYDNVYLAGRTTSTTAIATNLPLTHQPVIGGLRDAFLVKFDSLGVRQWGTYYGGTGDDWGTACAVDMGNNVYLTGQTNSLPTQQMPTPIALPISHQPTFGGGNWDAFLVKFNSAGVRQKATYYGGSGSEVANSCTVDKNGNVYIAGATSTNTPGGTAIATQFSHQRSCIGIDDAFLVKFNNNLTRQWGTYYGAGAEAGASCITDADKNVYMTGITTSVLTNTMSTIIATAGSHQPVLGGSSDAFLVKFNENGTRLWGTYYGGTLGENGYSCAVDHCNNIYVSGFTSSTGGINYGGYQSLYGGGMRDGFLVQFNSSGMCQSATYYGGSGNDYGFACTTDASDNVYIAGSTTTLSGIAIASLNGHQPIFVGNEDAFLAKFPLDNYTIIPPRTVCKGSCISLTVPHELCVASAVWYYSPLHPFPNSQNIPLGVGNTICMPIMNSGDYCVRVITCDGCEHTVCREITVVEGRDCKNIPVVNDECCIPAQRISSASDASDNVELFMISPNPVKDNFLQLSYQVAVDDQIKINLINSLGQVQSELLNEGVEANTAYKRNIDISNLSPGIYFLSIESASIVTKTIKFVKQ